MSELAHMALKEFDELFDHFAWYEEHREEMNGQHIDKHEWLDQLKQAFYKVCVAIFVKDPNTFRDLCDTEEFCEQIEMYGLSAYVDLVILGRHGRHLSKQYKNQGRYCGNEYLVTWRGIFTCDVQFK